MNTPATIHTPIIKRSKNFPWTNLQVKRADQVLNIVDELRNWLPLTLRQVFYQIVAKGHLKNTRSFYNTLSKLLKHMRIDGQLEWSAIEDATRAINDNTGFLTWQEFAGIETDYFLNGYSRNLGQGQSNHIELWYEKSALSRIFQAAARPYCISTFSTRGFTSITALHDFYDRAEYAKSKGQVPTILFFSDLDPSGVEMLPAIQNVLINDFGLSGIKYKRVALTPKQAKLFKLPKSVDAIKKGDKRAPAFIKKYGNTAIELDALHPQQLQKLVQDAIESQLDLDQFHKEMTTEKQDHKTISALRADVTEYVTEWFDNIS